MTLWGIKTANIAENNYTYTAQGGLNMFFLHSSQDSLMYLPEDHKVYFLCHVTFKACWPIVYMVAQLIYRKQVSEKHIAVYM